MKLRNGHKGHQYIFKKSLLNDNLPKNGPFILEFFGILSVVVCLSRFIFPLSTCQLIIFFYQGLVLGITSRRPLFSDYLIINFNYTQLEKVLFVNDIRFKMNLHSFT